MDRDLNALRSEVRQFVADRDWEQFHTLKNLAMALAVEAAELMEPLQWLPSDATICAPEHLRERLEEEAADVFLYLLMFCDRAGIDLVAAAHRKMAANAARYPVDVARGSAAKAPKGPPAD